MPFKSINELPESVKNVLPKHSQEIYKEAFIVLTINAVMGHTFIAPYHGFEGRADGQEGAA